jgi:hypothetical protein
MSRSVSFHFSFFWLSTSEVRGDGVGDKFIAVGD